MGVHGILCLFFKPLNSFSPSYFYLYRFNLFYLIILCIVVALLLPFCLIFSFPRLPLCPCPLSIRFSALSYFAQPLPSPPSKSLFIVEISSPKFVRYTILSPLKLFFSSDIYLVRINTSLLFSPLLSLPSSLSPDDKARLNGRPDKLLYPRIFLIAGRH